MQPFGLAKPFPPVFRSLFIGALILLLWIIPISSSKAQVPLYTFRTRNLRLIYYDENHEFLIPHLARCFENSLRFHRELFDYTPSEEVTILLQDFGDYGTAGTNTIPWNYINVGIEPFDYVYETSPTNERLNWVMNHELVHVLATDKAAKMDRFFRSLFFGKVSLESENPMSMLYSYLTTPRWYSPRWYHEGIAVFMETWMSGGIGRAQNGYDEMVFRAMVRDSAYFYDVVGLESEGTTIDFQVGVNSYLYGTRFVCYLAERYGIDKMLDWYNRTRESKRYFSAQFRKVYGVSLDEEWSRWIGWEHAWQEANLAEIHTHPVTPARPITQKYLGSVSRAFFDLEKRQLYVGMNFPGQIAHIASIDLDTGKMKKICDVHTPALYYVASLAYDPEKRQIFFTTHNSSRWRDIHMVDVDTGTPRALIENARVGDLAFNRSDRSLWGMRHHNGYSTLVRIPEPYEDIQIVLPLKYGKDLFDIDISPDGRLLTGSLVEINGDQRLIMMHVKDLMQGETGYRVIEEFEDNSPQNFVFSEDGRFLYGTSYYTGVSNVFRYDFEEEVMDIVSNAETGFFRPLPISRDSLLVFRYGGEGFLPVMISDGACTVEDITFLGQSLVEKYPVLETWKLEPPSPELIDLDTLTVEAGRYRSLLTMKLASVYPVVEGYKDFPAFGLRVNLLDPIGGIDAISLTAAYAPNELLPADERFHAAVKYNHWNWEFTAAYNGTDFYDLVGPTKTSRKGYALTVQYKDFLVYNKPRSLEVSFFLGGYGGLDRLPDYQNVLASYDKLLTARAQLNYAYLIRAIGAVEYEQGVQWQIATRFNLVNGRLFPRLHADLHLGLLTPLKNSSLWLRGSSGTCLVDADDPFANFYFGGFGNNWLDYGSSQRYREYYSFPGTDLNAIGGRSFGKLMAEWTLPPIRFRRFGFTSMYFRWARLALFTSMLSANVFDNSLRETFFNVGGQLDFRLVTFSLMKSTFSVGYAVSYDRSGMLDKEFMLSFKIL